MIMERKNKLFACVLFFVALVFIIGLCPSPASAQDLVRLGGELYIPEGEQANNTLVLFGSTRIDGEVWQGTVNIFGNTKINGKAGSVVAVGGPANITGSTWDLVVVGGSAAISGEVNGNLVVVGGSLHLTPSARIDGDMVVVGSTLAMDPGAVVTGSEVSLTLEEALAGQIGQWFKGHPFPGPLSPAFWWRLANLFLTAVVLVIISILFPKATANTAGELAKRPLPSFLWGILIAFLAIPTTILLFITILGIPLAGLLWLALACAYFLGFAGLSSLVGKKTLTALGIEQPELYLSALLGAIFIGIITLLPYAGVLVGWLLKITGLGAAVVSLANRRHA
jgi:cytoskeletal protein CcmA (bactofilin family)